MRRAATAVLAAALFAAAGGAGSPLPAGNWKFVLPLNPTARPMWILRLAPEGGGWTGAVVARSEEEPRAPAATLTGVSVADGTLRFTLRAPGQMLRFEGNLPKEADSPILGSVAVNGDVVPARLEPTALTSLDRVAVSRDVLAQKKEGLEAFRAALTLLGGAAEQKAKPEDVRAWADRAVKAAEPYGDRWRRDVLLSVVEILANQEGFAAAALPYARQAERLLDEKDTVSLKKRTLDALASTLERSGKAEEAAKVRARTAALDVTLKPAPYAGKRGGRVALVELFTGAQCPPCVAADLAFDALGKEFTPAEAVRLEYHLHVPGPDPLTSPAALARQEAYGKAIEGTPTLFVNGRPMVDPGGSRFDAADKLADLSGLVAGVVEQPAKASVTVEAKRKGSRVEIKAEARDPEGSGGDLRMRLVLAEAEVAYAGRNGISGYQNVVRDFPGGAEGTPLRDKAVTKSVTVDLDALRKELTDYLDKFAADNPFPSKARPLELKKLIVVAFLQSDATGEVLQAAQTEVPE